MGAGIPLQYSFGVPPAHVLFLLQSQGFKKVKQFTFLFVILIPQHLKRRDFRGARSSTLAHFVPWAELNAPVVAFIYARCVVFLLKANLLSFCLFESLQQQKTKKETRKGLFFSLCRTQKTLCEHLLESINIPAYLSDLREIGEIFEKSSVFQQFDLTPQEFIL